MTNYVVICLDAGQYVLTTRQVFQTRAQAEAYARGCSPSRQALVVEGRWFQLRPHGWDAPHEGDDAAG